MLNAVLKTWKARSASSNILEVVTQFVVVSVSRAACGDVRVRQHVHAHCAVVCGGCDRAMDAQCTQGVVQGKRSF